MYVGSGGHLACHSALWCHLVSPGVLLTLSLCVSVRSEVQDIVRGEVHGFCILYDGGVINKLLWEVSKILVYFRNNAEKIRINNALVMDDAVSNWIRTLRGESFKIRILLLLKLYILIWWCCDFFSFIFICIYIYLILKSLLQCMTITNVTTLTMRSFTSVSLSGIQTQEPLYTLIHGSSYSQLSNSYLTLVPDSFELWSVTKVSNNWATLFRTKLVWSQNWFKIGSFETENDDGQCVHSQDNSHSENETEISNNCMFFL